MYICIYIYIYIYFFDSFQKPATCNPKGSEDEDTCVASRKVASDWGRWGGGPLLLVTNSDTQGKLGFVIHGFRAGRKSSVLGVWVAPVAPKTIPKGAGLRLISDGLFLFCRRSGTRGK